MEQFYVLGVVDIGHLIGMAIVGLIIGVVAKLLMPGRDPGGCIVTSLLGIAGSALGGWLTLNFLPQLGILGSWGVAIVGTLLILIVYRLIFGERA